MLNFFISTIFRKFKNFASETAQPLKITENAYLTVTRFFSSLSLTRNYKTKVLTKRRELMQLHKKIIKIETQRILSGY